MDLMDKSEFKKLNKDHAERQAEDIIEELTNKVNKNGFYYNEVALDEYISMGVALLISDIIKNTFIVKSWECSVQVNDSNAGPTINVLIK